MSRVYIPSSINGRPVSLSDISNANSSYVSSSVYTTNSNLQKTTDNAQTALINQISTNLSNLNNSVNGISSNVSSVQTSVSSLQANRTTTSSQLVSITSQLVQANSNIDAIQATNTTQDTSISTLNNAVSSKQSQLNSSNKLLSDYVNVSGQTLTAKVSQMDTSLNSINTALTNVEPLHTLSNKMDARNIDFSQTNLQYATTASSDIQTQLNGLTNSMSLLSGVNGEAFTDLNTNVSNLQTSVSTLDASLNALATGITSQATSISNLTTGLATVDTKASLALSQNATTNSTITTVLNRLSSNDASISSMSGHDARITTAQYTAESALSTANNTFDYALTLQPKITLTSQLDPSKISGYNGQPNIFQNIYQIGEAVQQKQPIINETHLLDANLIDYSNNNLRFFDVSTSLATTLQNMDNSIETIENQIPSLALSSDLITLENTVISHGTSINSLNNTTDILDQRTTGLPNIVSTHSTQIGVLETDITTAQLNISDLQGDIVSINQSLDLKQDAITTTAKLHISKVDLSGNEILPIGTNAAMASQISNISSAISTLQGLQDGDITSFNQINTALTGKQSTINSGNKVSDLYLTHGSATVYDEIENIKLTITTIDGLNTQQSNSLSSLLTNVQTNSDAIDTINSTIATMEATDISLQNQINTKQDILNGTSNKLPISFIDLSGNPLNYCTTLTSNAQNQLTTLSNSVSTLNTSVETLNGETTQLASDISTLYTSKQNTIDASSNKLPLSHVDISTSGLRFCDLTSSGQNQIDTINSTLTQATGDIFTLQQSHQSIEADLLTASNGVQTATTSIATINTTLQDIQDDITSKTTSIQTLQTYNDNLDASLNSINTTISGKQATINSLHRLNANLVGNGDVSNTALSYVKNLTSDAQSQLTSVVNAISSLPTSYAPTYSDTTKMPISYIDLSGSSLQYINISSPLQTTIDNLTNVNISQSSAITTINSSLITMGNDVLTAVNTANSAYDFSLTRQAQLGTSNKLDGSYVQAPNGQTVVQAINSLNSSISTLTTDIATNTGDISTINTSISTINTALSSLTGVDTTTLSSISTINTHLTALDTSYNDLQTQIDNLPSGGGGGSTTFTGDAYDVPYLTTDVGTKLDDLTTSLATKQSVLNSTTNKLPIEYVELENHALSYVDISASLTQQLTTITNNVANLSSSDSTQTSNISTLSSAVSGLTTSKQNVVDDTHPINATAVSYSSTNVSAQLDANASSISTLTSSLSTANTNISTLQTSVSSLAIANTVVDSYTKTIPDDCSSIYSYGYTPSYAPFFNAMPFFTGLDNSYFIQCSAIDPDTGSVFFAWNKVLPSGLNSRLYKYDNATGKVKYISSMLSGDINCMVVLNGILYIGGNFTKYLAMYNIANDGFMNLGGQNGGGTNNIVYGMCINNYNQYSTDKGPRIFFCGAFTSVDGNNSQVKVGAFIPTTRQYIQFNTGVTQGTCYTICSGNSLTNPNNSGYVIVSGIFTSFGSATATTPPTRNFGYVNCANGATAGLANLTGSTTAGLENGYAWSMTYDPTNNAIIMGGNYTLAGGVRYLGRYSLTLLTATSFNFFNNAPSNTYNNYLITGIYNPPNTTQLYITGTGLNAYYSKTDNSFMATGNTILYDWSNSTYSNISGLGQGTFNYSTNCLSIAGDGLLFVGQSYGINNIYGNNGYALMVYNGIAQRIRSGELFLVKSFNVSGVYGCIYQKIDRNGGI